MARTVLATVAVFRILGPLEVLDGDRQVPLGGAKQRTLLAYLLLNANTVVPVDRLIDVLWTDDPPKTAAHTLQVYVSELRKVFRGSATSDVELSTEGRGYAIRVPEDNLDLHRFLELAAVGRRSMGAGDLEVAAADLQEALSIWRGDPFSDLPYGALPPAEIARLHELRLSTIEDRIDVDLELGRQQELVAELTGLVATNPLRERLRGQQMLALYRSGRQAEALQSYRDFQRTIADEFGIDPGQPLQSLERRILQQDADLRLTSITVEPSAPSRAKGETEQAEAMTARRRVPLWLPITAGAVVVVAVAVAVIAITGKGARGLAAPGPNTVARIDPSGASLVGAVPVGMTPVAIASEGDSVWVANFDDGTVQKVDARTNTAQDAIGLGVCDAPNAIATGGGYVWVASGTTGMLCRIDPTQAHAVIPIRLDVGIAGLAYGDGALWVTNQNDDSILRIDPQDPQSTPRVAKLKTGAAPTGIAIGAGAVWVAESLTAQVARIDPSTLRTTFRVPILGGNPAQVAVGEGFVWVTNTSDNSVTRIDPITNLGVRIPGVGDGPAGIAAGEGAVWVANTHDGSLAMIDPATRKVVRHVPLGTGLSAEGVALTTNAVWVSLLP